MGTGITRMQNLMKEAKLEPIQFRFTTFVTASFTRKFTTETAPEIVSQLGEKLGENEKDVLSKISGNNTISIISLAGLLGISTTGIEKILSRLKKKGKLKRIGPAKGGHWEVLEK